MYKAKTNNKIKSPLSAIELLESRVASITALWAVLVPAILLLSTLALTSQVNAALPPIDSRDVYIHKRLYLRLDYETENIKNTYENNNDTNSYTSTNFTQTYDFNFSGNAWDPRFIVYDAKIIYRNRNFSYDNNDSANNSWFYSFRTVLLRKFRYPLTLLVEKSIDKNESSTKSTEYIRNRYMLRWFLRFRTLPVTKITIQRVTNIYGPNTVTSMTYDLYMTKDYGPTKNSFSLSHSTGESNKATTVSFTNVTKISHRTSFSMNAVKSYSFRGSEKDHDGTGLSLDLNSKPSRFFGQSHYYSFYRAVDEYGTTTGNNYSGSLSYTPSERYTLSTTLNYFEDSTRSSTNNSEDERLSSGTFFNYTISEDLVFFQNINLSTSQSRQLQSASNENKFTSFNTDSGLNYRKRLGWASFSSSYGMGYFFTKSSPSELTYSGISNRLNLSLGGINARLFNISTGLGMSRQDSLSIAGWSQNVNANISANSRFLRKYLSLGTGYSTSRTWDFNPARDSHSQGYSIILSTNIIKRGTLSSSYKRIDSWDFISGDKRSENFAVTASYNAVILQGKLTLRARMRNTKHTFKGGNTDYLNYNINAKYRRPLPLGLKWTTTAAYGKGEDLVNSYSNSNATLTNNLYYQLRAWGLTAEHRYRLQTLTNGITQSESRIMFKATRTIFRQFYR